MSTKPTHLWKPGQSGNPAGRPPGAGLIGKLRAGIAQDVPEILAAMVQQAKAGDVQAARLLLERTLPAVRPEAAPVELPSVQQAQGLAQKAAAAIEAAADGQVSPDTAERFVGALQGLARIVEVSELEQRIAALEQAQQRKEDA